MFIFDVPEDKRDVPVLLNADKYKGKSKLRISELLDKHLGSLRITNRLINEFYKYQMRFINMNSEHVSFFGGVLLGVHVVRYPESYVKSFFYDILKYDPDDIVADYTITPGINTDWKVSSDVFNLTIFYLIYRVANERKLSSKQRDRGIYLLTEIFTLRTMAAWISNAFRYPVSEKDAQATYERLSGRYLIKQLGSWGAVVDYRSKKFMGKDSRHYVNIKKFSKDHEIIEAINDFQGGTRSMFKYIYRVHLETLELGAAAESQSSIDPYGDNETIRDIDSGIQADLPIFIGKLSDKRELVDRNILRLSMRLFGNAKKKDVIKVLEWISEKSLTEEKNNIISFVTQTLTFSHEYLSTEGYLRSHRNDIGFYMRKLKGMLSSSRSTDARLHDIREKGTELVSVAIQRTDKQTIAVVRTATIIYMYTYMYIKISKKK